MSDAALVRGRELAASRMTDTGRALEPTGRSVQNADGEEVPVYATRFVSRCKVQGQGRDGNVRMVTTGGVERPVVEGGLHLPVGSPEVMPGWLWEITAVGAASDVLLLGKRFLIDRLAVKSHATAHRYDVTEV